jgi:hypothetical protein
MLEQMRAHHRCVEGEMARQADGGRSMPGKDQMTSMMQRCPMPAAMRGSMMSMMMMNGGMPRDQNPQPESEAPAPEQHQHTPDAPAPSR